MDPNEFKQHTNYIERGRENSRLRGCRSHPANGEGRAPVDGATMVERIPPWPGCRGTRPWPAKRRSGLVLGCCCCAGCARNEGEGALDGGDCRVREGGGCGG